MDMIVRLCEGLASRLRIAFYRALGMRIHGRVSLRRIEVRRHVSGIELHDGAALDRGVTLLLTGESARIILGPQTYVNRHTMFDASERIEVGARTMIGPFCYFTDHDHEIAPGAAPGEGPLISRPTTIGPRCWIGAHVTILKGVTIGEGTVIGAGSVVTKSLPPGVIAVGNPARVLRAIVP
jgi:acetyltransferase-like isoleucine patch superfamily enzyme